MKNDFFLEEAVLDDLAKDMDLMEAPLSESAFKLVSFAAIFIIAVVFFDLAFLGIWKADFYKNKSIFNAGKMISIPAERGLIFDRYAKPFAENEPVFKLELKLAEFFKERRQVSEAFRKILSFNEKENNEFNGLIADINFEQQDFLALPLDLTENQAKEIEKLDLKSVFIKKDFKRKYKSLVFSHIVGYLGYVDKNFAEKNPDFSLNDIVGKSGLENYYDKELRGIDGRIIYYRNAKGEIIGEKFLADAKAGADIETTVDGDFQIYFYERLREKISEVNGSGGVGLALNPQNGEILALASIPSFNANEITQKDLNDSLMPFFNRAISGLYAPGSTIKPLHALAALKEGIINSKTEIFSRGYIEVPNPYYPEKPSRFVDWKSHGWVDLYSAIARSSNIYFYAIGGGLPNNETGLARGNYSQRGLGVEKLKEYWREFGFSEKTGIDLPAETSGFLPDLETKQKKNNEPWRLGDTYNISIGQGDLLITPLELLNYVAAVANDGKFYRPFIAKKIISENGKAVEINPQVVKDYSNLADYFKEIKKGMTDAANKPYGTAYLLSDLGMKVAAKTGTAQIEGNKKINAFFVGYAPADNPQIAILVLIENAREGGLNAVPVAKDAFRWYYENRIKI